MHKIYTFIIAAAIGFVAAIFIPKCDGGISNTTNDTTVRVDTFIRVDTVKIPGKKPKAEVIVDTQWMTNQVDTAAILQAYFNKLYYEDTLVHDSSLLVVVKDTVTKNRIISRVPFIVKSYPIITKTTEVTKYDNTYNEGLYAGVYAGQEFGIELSYLKKGNSFGIMLGNNGVSAKYARQINWKKVSTSK